MKRADCILCPLFDINEFKCGTGGRIIRYIDTCPNKKIDEYIRERRKHDRERICPETAPDATETAERDDRQDVGHDSGRSSDVRDTGQTG